MATSKSLDQPGSGIASIADRSDERRQQAELASQNANATTLGRRVASNASGSVPSAIR